MLLISFLIVVAIITMLVVLFAKFSKKDVKMDIFELANAQVIPSLDKDDVVDIVETMEVAKTENQEIAEEPLEKETVLTEVKENNPKKRMPDILKLTIFLAVLGLICAGLLAGMNKITAPIIEKNKQKELEATLAAVGVKNPVLVNDAQLVNGVKAIYEGQIDNADCYVFEISVANQYTNITTLIVIGKTDQAIKALSPVAGTPSFTTHGLDKAFNGNDFGVIGSNQNTYKSAFITVSGATVSSGSISKALELAYEQLGKVGK